ncbi:ATP-binding protein [Serratia marcescens]|nr:ATP-binding protein [Serratia marcescens]
MNSFSPFDPLRAKHIADTEVASHALKREISNILSSYVGWYDPFCELIQNSLDSIDEKSNQEKILNAGYQPEISIIVDISKNSLTVSDNGIGLSEEKFTQFLAPCFSFKSGGKTRGHKGVGATYLAYGFNYIQICTKTDDYSAIGKMLDARHWLTDDSPSGNPQIKPDSNGCNDSSFDTYKTGVSITVKFDQSTHPKELSWIKADTAEKWKEILLIKTGLGCFFKAEGVIAKIKTIDQHGNETELKIQSPEYNWPHKFTKKNFELKDIENEVKNVFNKDGIFAKLPSKLRDVECIYSILDKNELNKRLQLDDNEKSILERFNPRFYFSYMHSAKVWTSYNESLKIRSGHKIISPGIQLCANNMPQGEMIQIPLLRNIGRQNQIHIAVHFDNCSADMGRKGFQSEIVDFAKSISRKIIEDIIQSKYKKFFKANSGAPVDLKRQHLVETWKRDFEDHEKAKPLNLINKNFFNPVNEISISSIPTREQDVIALFNQLIAGGVIRGIKIMSTNEYFTYDGMFRLEIKEPFQHHLYDEEINPLGITQDVLDIYTDGFRSSPKILEYKFSLDGLIENIEDGSKNSNDIDLVVVWEIGKDYQGNYDVISYLNKDNLDSRSYHGLTHRLIHQHNKQSEMELIAIKDLIEYLNDSEEISKQQESLYG